MLNEDFTVEPAMVETFVSESPKRLDQQWQQRYCKQAAAAMGRTPHWYVWISSRSAVGELSTSLLTPAAGPAAGKYRNRANQQAHQKQHPARNGERGSKRNSTGVGR